MARWVKVAAIAVLALSMATGCEEEEWEPDLDAGEEPALPREDGGKSSWPDDEEDAGKIEDASVVRDAATNGDAAAVDDRRPDAGQAAQADAGVTDAQADATQEPPAPTESPRTEVPDELVGAWHDGALDFVMWENYREGYWAGRNAVPSREAMVFSKNGDAKFYRYEAAFNFYEELIDCEGTVAFGEDGTFTFYPAHGRKRFNDFNHRERSVDRALTPAELLAPKLAGKRSYVYDPADASKLRIIVPSSAPYNWYRKE